MCFCFCVSDECPVWPEEFSAPFTLYSTLPFIRGAKCEFYYSYTQERQAQMVSYPERCFPFVVAPLKTYSDLPCILVSFSVTSSSHSQSKGLLTLSAGVGAVPDQHGHTKNGDLKSITRPSLKCSCASAMGARAVRRFRREVSGLPDAFTAGR